MLIVAHAVEQTVSVGLSKSLGQQKRIEMFSIQTRFIWVWLLLIASVLISCSPGSTPPGANSIGGVVDGSSYSYHYWEEGLAILIWQNTSYGSGESCSGTASTEDPVYRLECNASAPEGRDYSWKVHATDGVTAEMWIEDQQFDLSKGTMFLVNIGEDGVQVEQLQRDLSDLERSNEAISALAVSDPDVANFMATNKTESDSPDVNDEYSLAELTDALRMTGQSVEINGPVDQPFFTVPGQVIGVNGEDVQVFEYPDSAAAAAEAAQISPDVSSVGTSMMTWVATPHFYAEDRLIVLYVGENEPVMRALAGVLGAPIATGQTAEAFPLEEPPTPSTDSEPSAPDQLHPLAGLVYRHGQDIWIIDEKGEPLFVFDEPSARLSADGRFVLYIPEYDPDIWLADLTTGETRNLTASSGRYNGSAQWWPGRQDVIIFGSSDDLGPGFGNPTTVLIDGSDYRILDEERSGPLALSADGEKLAYGGFDFSGRIMQQGSAPVDLDPSEYGLDIEEVFQPAWSPDGRKIAWKVGGDQARQGWTSGVAVFDLENKSAELFHTYTAVGGGGVPHYLSFSPNGEWLAFVTFNESAEDGRRPNLWIARPDGQGEERLGTAFESAWHPDGSRLAFTLFDVSQETFQVWLHDTVTGEQMQILSTGTTAVDWLAPTDELMQTLRQNSTTQ